MPHSQKSDSNRIDYRCERCWSEKDINLYPKSEFMGDHVDGFVILCERCKSEAPGGGGKEKEFEDLFLKFASPKEFILYHGATGESEAMEKWRGNRDRQDSGDIVEQGGDSHEEDFLDEVDGADVPFGYELRNDMLQIINDDASVVQNIFDRYQSGQTMESIARALANNQERSGMGWNVGVVRIILKNPVYAGYEFKGGEAVKANHDPIIERKLFNSVQERIQRNIRNPRHRAKPLILGD